MIRFDRNRQGSQSLRGALHLAVLACMAAWPGLVAGQPLSFSPVSQPGIGGDRTDARQNSYSWSMAWFQGKLYVGTNRDFPVIENKTLAYYYPFLAPILATPPDVYNTPNFYDLDLRAQIWQYTPWVGTWQLVYRSDTQPNPYLGEEDKPIALDIGYRDMRVFVEPDGTEALYAVGCTVREFNPSLQPPRILRSTDGITWNPVPFQFTPLAGDPALRTDGTINAITFRATATYNGRFYVTASGGLTGDGFLLESSDPASGQFRQVTPSSLHIYELSTFNNQLYIGAADSTSGYSVLRTSAAGSPPYAMTPVVTGGAGRGQVMTSVVSMYPFRDKLYVGSAGWYSTPLPSCELIRINPDDSWQVVVGNPRIDLKRGLMLPISGLPDGFANPFNAHVWRMSEYNGLLFAGTNDDSWSLRGTILEPFTSFQFGFDLFSSPDGVKWTQVTRNAFGHPYDFGCRTLVPTSFGMFLGSVDYVNGTTVYLGQGAGVRMAETLSPAAPPTSGLARAGRATSSTPADSAATGSLVAADPANRRPEDDSTAADSLAIESLGDGNGAVLSWEPVAGEARYQVFRSTYQTIDLGRLPNLPPLQGVGLEPPGPETMTSRSISVPGPEILIGTTTAPYFADRNAVQGRQYAYYVSALDRKKRRPTMSNLVVLPDPASPVTFADVRKSLDGLVAGLSDRDRARLEEKGELATLVTEARASAMRDDLAGSQGGLTLLAARLSPGVDDVSPSNDVRDVRRMVTALARRVGLARSGLLAARALIEPGSPTP